MNKSVKGVNWLDTLPNSLAIDKDIKAFAAAFSNQLNKIADELMRINYVDDYEEAEELAEEVICNEMICDCNDRRFM